jgi:hypothetical protein
LTNLLAASNLAVGEGRSKKAIKHIILVGVEVVETVKQNER